MPGQTPKSKRTAGRSIPPPATEIPPRGIGPISEPNRNDVLSGRGGRINAHEGNVQFRDIINANKHEYLSPQTKKLEKAHIAARLVTQIRHMDPPGRFLKEDADTGLWYDIGDEKARKKVGQALREDAPDIRGEIEVPGNGTARPAVVAAAAGAGAGSKAGSGGTATTTGTSSSSPASADANKTPSTPAPLTSIRTSPIVTPPVTAVHSQGPQHHGPTYRQPFLSGRGMGRGGPVRSGSSPRFAPPHPMSYGYPPHSPYSNLHGGGGGGGLGGSQGSLPSVPSPPAIAEGGPVYHDGRGYPQQPQQQPQPQAHPQAPQAYAYYDGNGGHHYQQQQQQQDRGSVTQRMAEMAQKPMKYAARAFSPLVGAPHGQPGGTGTGTGAAATMNVVNGNAATASGKMAGSNATFEGRPFHPVGDSANSSSTVSEISMMDVGGSGGHHGLLGGGGGGAGAAAAASSRGDNEPISHRSAWQSNHLAARQERYAAQGQLQPAPVAAGPGGELPDAFWSAGCLSSAKPSINSLSHSISIGKATGRHGAEYGNTLKVSDKTATSSSASRASRMSDLSMSLAFSSLNRSMSLPGLKSSDLMSLGDASFTALLEDSEIAAFDANLRKENPSYQPQTRSSKSSASTGEAAGGDGAGLPPSGKGSGSSKSNVSALSSDPSSAGGGNGGTGPGPGAAGPPGPGFVKRDTSGPEGSSIGNVSMAEASAVGSVRSSASSWLNAYRGMASVGSEMNPWGGDDHSSRSVLSEISTDLMALDLAADGPAGQTFPSG